MLPASISGGAVNASAISIPYAAASTSGTGWTAKLGATGSTSPASVTSSGTAAAPATSPATIPIPETTAICSR